MSQVNHSTTAKASTTHSVNNERSTHMKKDYVKEAKNARALVQVTGWLKAAKINVTPSPTKGCDLRVQTKTGETIEVQVASTSGEPQAAADVLRVLATDLTSKHKAVALATFHAITQAAGYGTPAPVDRGPEPEKKLHYDDNFELVSMRHKEFRRVPNPTRAELAQYSNVIKKAIGRFMYINTVICRKHLVQFEDLETYALVWTCNYLGLYKVANPTVNDNERKLYAHLCQRFAEFAAMLVKKEKSCIPDTETSAIAIFGRTIDVGSGNRKGGSTSRYAAVADEQMTGVDFEDAGEEFGLVDEGVETDEDTSIEEETQLTKSALAVRRKDAQVTLATALGSMEHQTLIDTLSSAYKNPDFCYDARREAQKQLRVHKASCAVCAEALKVQEDLARENAGSGTK